MFKRSGLLAGMAGMAMLELGLPRKSGIAPFKGTKNKKVRTKSLTKRKNKQQKASRRKNRRK